MNLWMRSVESQLRHAEEDRLRLSHEVASLKRRLADAERWIQGLEGGCEIDVPNSDN
jgi:hypothetical protein